MGAVGGGTEQQTLPSVLQGRLIAAPIKSLGENPPMRLAQHQPPAPRHAASGVFKDSYSGYLERLSRSCL